MRIAQRFNVGCQPRALVSPEGTADSLPEVPFVGHTAIQPSLRDLCNPKPRLPTLKRWAILACPFGTDCGASRLFVLNVVVAELQILRQITQNSFEPTLISPTPWRPIACVSEAGRVCACPGGTLDNSPAFQRWVWAPCEVSRVGDGVNELNQPQLLVSFGLHRPSSNRTGGFPAYGSPGVVRRSAFGFACSSGFISSRAVRPVGTTQNARAVSHCCNACTCRECIGAVARAIAALYCSRSIATCQTRGWDCRNQSSPATL